MMMYVWKEWKEQIRGKGLWISVSMIMLLSIAILVRSIKLPVDQSYEVFLLSLYEMQVYFLPLVSLFLASFSIMQEKELKTLVMIITKRDSYRSFLFKKSVSIHTITICTLIGWYIIFAIPSKYYLNFSAGQFVYFLLTTIFLIVIFNQIGLFIGSVCQTRMQVVGANIFTWFFFLFLVDYFFIYFLPSVTYDNIKLFSIFYFLDPLHIAPFFLETALGIFSIEHMSRMMERFVWMSPLTFFIVNLILWLGIMFEFGVWFHRKGES